MISSITYGTLTGQLAPLIAYDVVFNGAEPSSDMEIADYQLKITSSPYRSQTLRVSGDYPSGDTMFAFLKPFATAKTFTMLIAVTNGQVSYPWQMFIRHTIVKLQRATWPVLPCHEIHYPYPPDGSLPVLSPSLHTGTFALIIPPAGKGNHVTKVFDLVAKTHGRWGVLHEPGKIWQKIIYTEAPNA